MPKILAKQSSSWRAAFPLVEHTISMKEGTPSNVELLFLTVIEQ
jgi:hypothetical protein